jgi:gliding motility-associated-like protein
LISYDSVAIALSRDTIFKSTQTGSLQYGPDCKLYITGEQHLHVLENPNQIGGGANFLENEVALLGRYAGEGLPNYVAGEQCYHISDQTICISDTLKLEYFDSCLNSITWDFDDEASSTNIQTTNQAQHIFSNTGLYFIKLKARYAGDTLNFFARIKVIAPPPANGFLPDSLFNCTDGALSANFDLGEFSYQWTNGYDSEYVIFDSAGLYSLTLSNQCGIAVDSVRIVFLGQPSVSLPADTSICENVTLQISPKIAGAQLSYNWWRGDTSISISIALNYDEIIWVEVSNRCGTDRDSMQIKSLSSPDVSWFSDSILCGLATPIVPNPASDNATYFLVADSVDGDTLNPWEIRIDSLYFLIGLNTCDTLLRQAHLSPNNIIAISSSDETICDDPITISADWPESSYLWNTGETSSTIEVDEPGSYSATVTNGSCSLSLTKNVLLNPDCDSVDCKFFFPNVLSPNADGINDLFRISNSCENEVFDVFIYNRWGVNLIQQRCSGYFSWDGYTNGTRAPDGTYYLVIQNEGKSLNGYFTLLRD